MNKYKINDKVIIRRYTNEYKIGTILDASNPSYQYPYYFISIPFNAPRTCDESEIICHSTELLDKLFSLT